MISVDPASLSNLRKGCISIIIGVLCRLSQLLSSAQQNRKVNKMDRLILYQESYYRRFTFTLILFSSSDCPRGGFVILCI